MSVKIRLTRTGRHNDPSYRIVVADSRFPRDGRYIELLGTFDPLMNTTKIDEEKAIKWIKDGAQLSDTVRALFSKAGIIAKVSKKGE